MELPESIQDLQNLEFTNYRRIWKPFMEKYNIQTLAEIGIFEGENFKRMIEHNPEVAIGVDAWINDGRIERNDCGLSQERLNNMHDKVILETQDKPFVRIIRGYTFDVADYFPDEYFDLIYIDGDHTYTGCLRDIKAWAPKVKSGGFITGDDYSNYVSRNTGVKFGVIASITRGISSGV